MSRKASGYIHEILANVDCGKERDVAPIVNADKNQIIPLDEAEALIVWKSYFPENVKYALLFERVYGEPAETSLLDESQMTSDLRNERLQVLHADNTPIIIFWSRRTALQTTWGMLVKYWDNFFYYPEDALIYLDQDRIYFYNEMILRKMNNLTHMSETSAFDCLRALKDGATRQNEQIACLFTDDSNDFKEDLFYLFYRISEGLHAIEDEGIRRECLEYCMRKVQSDTEKILLTCNPYDPQSVQNQSTEQNVHNEQPYDVTAKRLDEVFDDIVKKLSVCSKNKF